jgi:hypothetical protein
MALYQINQLAQTASSLKNTFDQFKGTDDKGKNAANINRVNDSDLIDTQKYSEELAAEESKKAQMLDEQPKSRLGQPEPIELDEFLKSRKTAKSREFKRLQQEQGFYFSDAMNNAVLHEMRANEGYYLIGVNFSALFDLFNYSINHQGEPTYDEYGNPMGIPQGDILADGDSMALIGEWVDKGREYDKILADQVGLRLGPDAVLKPEDVLDGKSRFKDIITEGRRYTGMSRKYLNPLALYNMVRILDKYKRDEVQWLRTATAIEIVYKYMNRGMSRQTFFASRAPLDEAAILELDEFFKTDHLFMILDEITRLKSDLEFYRFGRENNPGTNNNTNKANTATTNTTKSNTANTKNNNLKKSNLAQQPPEQTVKNNLSNVINQGAQTAPSELTKVINQGAQPVQPIQQGGNKHKIRKSRPSTNTNRNKNK